ncbi:MAG TPA: J domain-containing protein [Chthoniobacteraceae bacterium]|jgi:curved DNA-binding protein
MPVQYKDYYATLGVPKTASHDDIRKAFRKLARQFHPDVAKDKKTAESKFKEINEAYEVLSDPEKRQKYDTLGADWERGPQQASRGWGEAGNGGGNPFGGASFGGTGFSDFFEQFFSGAGTGRRRGGGMGGFPTAPERGGDVEADLLVSIEEALHGAKKKISFRRSDSSKLESFEVGIPKGVREGQKIRLAGQGEGAGSPEAGDLYLRVRLERHPEWQADGADLIYDLEIPAARAVLGTEVEVPTPDGSIRLKIPAGSQPGRKFRLKGRGLPATKDTRGDFFVKLTVELPEAVAGEERELWQKLAQLGR